MEVPDRMAVPATTAALVAADTLAAVLMEAMDAKPDRIANQRRLRAAFLFPGSWPTNPRCRPEQSDGSKFLPQPAKAQIPRRIRSSE